MRKARYLFIVAHPDDEVLGAGATIHRLCQTGHDVGVCILSCACKTRYDEELRDAIKKSHAVLGVGHTFFGDFDCLSINKAPHYDVVEYIEACMKEFDADVIVTHHPNDTNIDHYTVSEIVGEAARLSQRQLPNVKIRPLRKVLYMEVPSATDWSFNSICKKFEPNTYVPVHKDNIEHKIEALAVYDYVLRPVPHPRSVENLWALSVVRGSQAGYKYAEAFECVFSVTELEEGNEI